jgi:hypothetical protein
MVAVSARKAFISTLLLAQPVAIIVSAALPRPTAIKLPMDTILASTMMVPIVERYITAAVPV